LNPNDQRLMTQKVYWPRKQIRSWRTVCQFARLPQTTNHFARRRQPTKRHPIDSIATMKLTIPTLCVLALIKAAVFVEACPYLNTEMEVPDLETVEAVKVGGTKQDDRRLRTNSRASFRARIRKFLNRLDFLNLIPNPSPKAPPATKAPVVVAAPTSPAPKAAPPTPVAAAPGTTCARCRFNNAYWFRLLILPLFLVTLLLLLLSLRRSRTIQPPLQLRPPP
jgi:hypothetical protein